MNQIPPHRSHCSRIPTAGFVARRREVITPNPKLKLLDQVREIMRHASLDFRWQISDFRLRVTRFA